jgi:hypothetical protein
MIPKAVPKAAARIGRGRIFGAESALRTRKALVACNDSIAMSC